MVPLSPLSRKRGKVAVSTTGSRTVTSVVARPSLVAVHATAITRAVPANSGMSKLISAVPSAADRDDAGIERQRLLRRRTALQLGAGGIAAGPDLAARALHAVDQLPVEVADFRGHAALAEIVVVRRRRLVVGQIENADVDGGNDDLGVLAGIEAAELDGNLQRGAGPHQRRRRQVHLQACGPSCRCRTISGRSPGRASARRRHRAAGAASPPHRRRCPSPCRREF